MMIRHIISHMLHRSYKKYPKFLPENGQVSCKSKWLRYVARHSGLQNKTQIESPNK